MTNATAPGIPTAISRPLYLELIKFLGIENPEHIVKIEFRWNLIYVELKAIDDDGHWILDGDHAAVHKIVIPIDEDLEPGPGHGE